MFPFFWAGVGGVINDPVVTIFLVAVIKPWTWDRVCKCSHCARLWEFLRFGIKLIKLILGRLNPFIFILAREYQSHLTLANTVICLIIPISWAKIGVAF